MTQPTTETTTARDLVAAVPAYSLLAQSKRQAALTALAKNAHEAARTYLAAMPVNEDDKDKHDEAMSALGTGATSYRGEQGPELAVNEPVAETRDTPPHPSPRADPPVTDAWT